MVAHGMLILLNGVIPVVPIITAQVMTVAGPGGWVDMNEGGLARPVQLEKTSLERSLDVVSRMSRNSAGRELVMVSRAFQMWRMALAKVPCEIGWCDGSHN